MYLDISGLSKQKRGVKILDDITIRFEGGKIYGLQGKNGSGKTMLMRAICGLIIPTSGVIDINGDILHKDISFPKSIGALIENPAFLAGYTGFENLRILSGLKGRITDAEIKSVLNAVGLDPNDKRPYKKYSLGMKQKLGIACAVMENPRLIILDEPINALDESGVERVHDILKKVKNKDTIIIIACHDREELETLSDEIVKISNGRIET